MRRHERTGRPLGALVFVEMLEGELAGPSRLTHKAIAVPLVSPELWLVVNTLTVVANVVGLMPDYESGALETRLFCAGC